MGSYSMQIAASIIFGAIENNYTFQYIFDQRRRQIYAANDLTWRFYTGLITILLVHLSIKKLHLVQIVTYENCLIEWTDKPL